MLTHFLTLMLTLVIHHPGNHANHVAHHLKIKHVATMKLYTSGVASWYGPGFQGQPTASGVTFDTDSDMCAMKDVRLGTIVTIENKTNHRKVTCRILDRGPYVGDRVLDMSHAVKVALAADDLTDVNVWVSDKYH